MNYHHDPQQEYATEDQADGHKYGSSDAEWYCCCQD